jgi:hypothetical protein
MIKACLIATAIVATSGCDNGSTNPLSVNRPDGDTSNERAASPADAASDGDTDSHTDYPQPTMADVTGLWSFACCDGKYSGTIALVQSGSVLTGNFMDTSNNTTGVITGTVIGSNVLFTRRFGDASSARQDYVLTLSADGKVLTGTFSGDRDTSVGVDMRMVRISGP